MAGLLYWRRMVAERGSGMLGDLRRLGVVAVLVALALAGVRPAWAEKRVALVIGNAAYPTSPLANPVNDARAMAAKLKDVGFEVLLRENATKAQMEDAIGLFGEKLSADATGLMFYAGHGMQVNGRNYLVPVDARIASEQRVKLETVDAEVVLDQMAAAKARVSLVILDACRNNPFERRWRGGSSGLATMNAPEGTLVAYATAPGKVAADGEERNGLYTGELLKVLGEPGLPVEEVFKRVRVAVSRASNGGQTPWEASSLTGDLYFVPKGGAVAAPSPSPSSSPVPVDADAMTCEALKGSGSAGAFEEYLRQFPNGQCVPYVRVRLADLTPKPQSQPQPQQVAVTSPPPRRDFAVGEGVRDCDGCPEVVVVPAGNFMMGSDDEGPVRRVTIPRPFAVGKYEVTQAEYEAVMGNNPSAFKKPRNPVENVSWDDAREFIRKLNAKVSPVARASTGGDGPYRLLTESEWEYAARAGTTTDYWWGDEASHEHANYGEEECCGGTARGRDRWEGTSPVGSFPANAFGLHDMHGNVGEWVQDCWNDDYSGAPTDGSAWVTGDCNQRVLRGGSWYDVPWDLRSALRGGNDTGDRIVSIGFRLARTLP
ncbi:MAG: SUMF1/EgtB/PvdO family nonheme iron enzyme [Alphaproteobacteria bacterium]|nr:SUMF1/EgtB/PvdO family nonheme iron enzyme [Alphaproteobacteria bacterium]